MSNLVWVEINGIKTRVGVSFAESYELDIVDPPDGSAPASSLWGSALAYELNDPESPVAQSLAASIDAAVLPVLEGPLGRWKGRISTAPSTGKVVFLGDSTSAGDTQASVIMQRLLGLHSQHGEALYGVGSSDYYTDGVGNGTTTFTSATANFTSADRYRLMHGKGFLPATIISSVTNSTTVVLSNAVTTGTALPFWVGRSVIAGGNNGQLLSYWLANPNFTVPTYGLYSQTKMLTDAPHLTVASWLINDIRTGGLGTTVDACVTAGTALLQQFVDWHRTNLPDTDLLLRIPNSLLSENVSGLNAVTNGVTTNPAGQAQIYSTALRRIYLSFVGRYDNVDVIDTQAPIFGTRSRSKLSSDPRMFDQLHPSTYTAADLYGITPVGGGYSAISDAIASRIGFSPNAFPDQGASRAQYKLLIYSAPSTGVARCISIDPNVLASQLPVLTTDPAFVNGIESAQTITNVDPFVGANFLQLTFSGSTDFTPYIGRVITILGTHVTGLVEKSWQYIDPPAVSAGSWAQFDITVAGVTPGNTGRAVGVYVLPGATFTNQTDVKLTYRVVGDDTVRCRLDNEAVTTKDIAGESWTFWLVR